MTLAEYKRQAQEIVEILMNFSEKEGGGEEFAKTLMKKYIEFGEFNAKALECKNLAEFKNLADANGMKFESDDEANELFLGLSKGKKEVEKAILSSDEMAVVSGGGGGFSVARHSDTMQEITGRPQPARGGQAPVPQPAGGGQAPVPQPSLTTVIDSLLGMAGALFGGIVIGGLLLERSDFVGNLGALGVAGGMFGVLVACHRAIFS